MWEVGGLNPGLVILYEGREHHNNNFIRGEGESKEKIYKGEGCNHNFHVHMLYTWQCARYFIDITIWLLEVLPSSVKYRLLNAKQSETASGNTAVGYWCPLTAQAEPSMYCGLPKVKI